MHSSKGQSTVEYILLVTAVIGVIVLFTTSSGSLFQTRLNSVLDQTTNSMVNVAGRLQAN
jgi:hypothetical protein